MLTDNDEMVPVLFYRHLPCKSSLSGKLEAYMVVYLGVNRSST